MLRLLASLLSVLAGIAWWVFLAGGLFEASQHFFFGFDPVFPEKWALLWRLWRQGRLAFSSPLQLAWLASWPISFAIALLCLVPFTKLGMTLNETVLKQIGRTVKLFTLHKAEDCPPGPEKNQPEETIQIQPTAIPLPVDADHSEENTPPAEDKTQSAAVDELKEEILGEMTAAGVDDLPDQDQWEDEDVPTSAKADDEDLPPGWDDGDTVVASQNDERPDPQPDRPDKPPAKISATNAVETDATGMLPVDGAILAPRPQLAPIVVALRNLPEGVRIWENVTVDTDHGRVSVPFVVADRSRICCVVPWAWSDVYVPDEDNEVWTTPGAMPKKSPVRLARVFASAMNGLLSNRDDITVTASAMVIVKAPSRVVGISRFSEHWNGQGVDVLGLRTTAELPGLDGFPFAGSPSREVVEILTSRGAKPASAE